MAIIYLCLCAILQVPKAPEDRQTIEPYANWVGKKCLSATLEDMEFTADRNAPKPVAGSVFQVLAVQGRMIRIRDEKNEVGWVQKRWLVLAEEAPDFFTAKLKEGPHPHWFYQRAQAWELKGELSKAVEDVTRANELFPHLGNLEYRAKLFGDLGEYEKSLKDWTHVIKELGEVGEKNRRNATDAYTGRGRVYAMMGNSEKALDDLNYALKLDSKNDIALTMRGSVYRNTKEYEKALADFNQAIILNPDSNGVYQQRSLLWKRKKEYAKAIEDAEKNCVQDHNSHSSLTLLAKMLTTCPDQNYRNSEKALRLAKKAYEISPRDPLSWETLSEAYAESGNFEKALEWQKKVLADPRCEKTVDGEWARMVGKYFEQKKRPWHDDEKLP